MKKTLVILATLAALAATSKTYAAATISLNNYDSDKPIFYLKDGTKASGADVFVEVLAGPVGGVLAPVANTSALSKFGLSEPGYFDNAVGVIPGLADGAQVDVQVRTWKGGASYDVAAESGISAKWTQASGTWNPNASPPVPASGPALGLTSSITILPVSAIPEPSVVILAMLGGAAVLIRRRK